MAANKISTNNAQKIFTYLRGLTDHKKDIDSRAANKVIEKALIDDFVVGEDEKKAIGTALEFHLKCGAPISPDARHIFGEYGIKVDQAQVLEAITSAASDTTKLFAGCFLKQDLKRLAGLIKSLDHDAQTLGFQNIEKINPRLAATVKEYVRSWGIITISG